MLEDRRAVMIAHKSAQGSLKVQNGGRKAIEVLAVAPPRRSAAPRDTAHEIHSAAPSARHTSQSQSSSTPHGASMLVTSQPVSSRPSSRDLSPSGRVPSHSHRITADSAAAPSTAGAAAEGDSERTPAKETVAQPSGNIATAGAGGTPASPAANAGANGQDGESSARGAPVVKPTGRPDDIPANAKRVRGTVVRVLKKSKRLPAGLWLGVLRSVSNENWARPKAAAPDATAATPAIDPHATANLLKEKGLAVHAAPGDVLFWSSDVASAEVRGALQKNDEVEYIVVSRPLEEGDAQSVEMALDVALVRSGRSAQSSAPKWQPPAAPFTAGGRGSGAAGAAPAARKPNQYKGVPNVVVPGPEKGTTGFAAGRGRPIDKTAKKTAAPLGTFRLEDVVGANEFVPKRAASAGLGGGSSGSASREPLATMLDTADSQFEDA